MSHDDPKWERLIRGLRDGDEQVAGEFYAQYGPMLERIASSNLQSGLLRRVGPDEVAHSACRTFLRRIHEGEFELDGRDKLWNLLCAITLHKTRKQARHHLADKRGIGREERPADDEEKSADRELAAAAPTPAEAAEFADQFEHLLATMDEEERRIVSAKLERRDHDEIATMCGVSGRTVRRILHRVEARILAGLGEVE